MTYSLLVFIVGASLPSDEKRDKTRVSTIVVIGASVAAAVVFSLIALVLALQCKKRRKHLDDTSNPFDPEKPGKPTADTRVQYAYD